MGDPTGIQNEPTGPPNKRNPDFFLIHPGCRALMSNGSLNFLHESPIMTEISISRNCKECGKKRRFVKQKLSTFWGIVLTIVTCGIFLIYWIPLLIWEAFRPFRCVDCGLARRT